MITYPGIKLGVFARPDERQQLQTIDNMLRQISAALSRSVFPGTQPAANPVTPNPPSGTPGLPAPTQGDMLYGLLAGSWAKLPIGAAGTILSSNGGIPAWSTGLSLLPVHDHSIPAQGGLIPNTSVTGLGTMSTQAASSVSITGGSVTGITDLALADGGTGASTQADAALNILPSVSGNTLKVLRVNAGETAVEWATSSGGTNTLLDGSNHTDTTNSTVVRGDLVVGNSASPPAWTRLAKGSSGQFLKAGASDTAWATLAASDLPTHGAAQHTDRDRTVSMPVGCWESNTKTLYGTAPDTVAYISFPTGATARTHLIFQVPKDYSTGAQLTIYGSMSANSTLGVQMLIYSKKFSIGTLVNAAYDNVEDALFVPPATATDKFLQVGVTISTTLAADDYVRFVVERDVSMDTNPNEFRFMGATFTYTADM